MKSRHVTSLSLYFTLLLSNGSAFAESLTPPPPPEVPPIISESYSSDQDRDKIDDRLITDTTFDLYASEPNSPFPSEPNSPVPVELIFKEQIMQKQIDDFLLLGGEITYIYKTLSYGWNGWILPSQIPLLPAIMGETLMLVQAPTRVVAYMDVATQIGRVRPIWRNNFAGNPLGFDGDASITIAVVDSGVDATHPDIAGRCAYWADFTPASTGRSSSPTDPGDHGSHVAGIVVGTGQADGAAGALRCTWSCWSATWSSLYLASPIVLSDTTNGLRSTAYFEGAEAAMIWFHWKKGSLADELATIENAAFGSSPLVLNRSFRTWPSHVFAPCLFSNSPPWPIPIEERQVLRDVVITTTVDDYPSVGDGFNRFSGVAPGCRWAGARVFDKYMYGQTTWTAEAMDDLIANRRTHNIKVVNLSLGLTEGKKLDSFRQKFNSAVKNGIVVVIAAGNDGLKDTTTKQEIADPGRAALAITVGASNDENALTAYSSHGFSSPGTASGKEEDYKPDIMAPGGSDYHTGILSVDSGSSDGPGSAEYPDRQSNDYCSKEGTSMASPFIAGCAALVIDAMQQKGIVWDFYSSKHPLYVKMVLCATATETNQSREDGHFNPSLERAANGEYGFPAGKDRFEGYGVVNPDAAVEAVCMTYTVGSQEQETFGSGPTERRAWARTMYPSAGQRFKVVLTNPFGADFDLYLYSRKPTLYGAPVVLLSSTLARSGVEESVEYMPSSSDSTDGILLVVKRIAGSGTFLLKSSVVASGTEYRSTDVPKDIPDKGTVISKIQITDTGKVVDIDVKVNITHPYDGDLDVFLIAPDGTRVELFTDVGGSSDDFSDTILDNEAGAAITGGSTPFAGRYRPEGSLGVLKDKNVTGTWTLEIADDSSPDVGRLNSWSLIVQRSAG